MEYQVFIARLVTVLIRQRRLVCHARYMYGTVKLAYHNESVNLVVILIVLSQGNGGYSSGDDSPSRQNSSSYSRPSMPQDTPRSPLTPAPTYSPAHPSGRVGAGAGAGDEAHLVDDMCTPGGLRAQPDREDLRLFVENAASLNGTTVAQLLQAKMVRMRRLSCWSCGWRL